MFEIQKSDDATIRVADAQKRVSWPWKQMSVGDMVRVDDKALIPRAQAYCHVYGRQAGVKFSTQTIHGVLHIWRVE